MSGAGPSQQPACPQPAAPTRSEPGPPGKRGGHLGRDAAAFLASEGLPQLHGAYPRRNGRDDMKIRIRQQDDAGMPQEDGWSQMGDWLAELGDDDHTKPSGDGHAEPDGTDDSRLEAPAQA